MNSHNPTTMNLPPIRFANENRLWRKYKQSRQSFCNSNLAQTHAYYQLQNREREREQIKNKNKRTEIKDCHNSIKCGR